MLISKKIFRYSSAFALSGLFVFITACSENSDAPLEVFEPMSCTIPGKLELDSETRQSLSQYELPR